MSVTNPTEVEKLQAYLNSEKKKGLVDFKFTTQGMLDAIPSLVDGPEAWLAKVRENHAKTGMTAESLAKEINAMLTAPTINDTELD
jgi:hypothetical protein